jgi:hypothetical protein
MAHSFKSSSGKSAFGVFSEPQNAGDYIYNKKAKTTFCRANKCVPSKTVNTQGNLLLLNRSNRLKYYACVNSINKANLNINLITKLDLLDVPVIKNVDSNNIPIPIISTEIPYLDYVIDPSGALFGNTICGVNNYVKYLVYNPPYKTDSPGHIDNL